MDILQLFFEICSISSVIMSDFVAVVELLIAPTG